MSAPVQTIPKRPAFFTPLVHPYVTVFVCIAVILLITGYGLLIAASGGQYDLAVVTAVNSAHAPAFDALAVAINWLFSPNQAVVVLVAVALAVWLVTRRPATGLAVIVITGLSWVGSDIIKRVVDRSRPDTAALTHSLVAHPSDPSFPSGHTVFVASLCMAIILTMRAGSGKVIAIVVSVVVVVIVAASRVYLGVHFPDDVLAGALYAVAASLLVFTLIAIGEGVVRGRSDRAQP